MSLFNLLIQQKRIQAKHTLFICGILSCCFYIYLLYKSQNFASATVFDLWLVGFACALLSFVPWYHYHVSKPVSQTCPGKRDSLFFAYVVGFALLFRLIGFFTFPVLEDDFYRYLWDGYMLVENGSPYISAPSAYFGVEDLSESLQHILDNINHPEIGTVYGPVCQWLFGLAYVISPASLWPIKLMILFADIALIFILIALMRAQSIRPHFLLLYAWCPLIIKEFVITAHPDIFGVLFMFTGLLAWQRQAFLLAATSLALAVASKVFALIIVPLVLGLKWQRWAMFLLTCLLVSWPLGLIEAWAPEGLKAMASIWLFNAPLYILLIPHVSFTFIKLFLLVTFASIWLMGILRGWWPKPNTVLRGDILFGLFFLCLPALNAWYFVWILPFGIFYPSRTVWFASVALLLSYGVKVNDTVSLYDLPNCVLLFEYLGLITALYFDLRTRRKELRG